MSPAATRNDAASTAGLKVTTNPLPASRLAMEVAVPAERSRACYEAAVEKLSRSVRLPGFRKGKVPRPVLLQQIGPLRIRATALEELVDSVCRDALQQEEIPAISRPELKEGFETVLERFEPGSEITITLEMDIEPTPKLRSTKGLKAEVEAVAFDPARVDELIEQSRRQLATLVPVEGRQAVAGDVAQIRFSGTYGDDSSPISGGSSEGMEVELEEGRMIAGFIEGIVGMAIGETRTVECRFPEDYPQQEAAGRPAVFSITLLELKQRELPELDDAFARQASDKETLAELRAELERRLQEDGERRGRSNRQDALVAALVEQLEVELPETLVQQEIRNLVEQTAGQIAQQGMDVRRFFTPDLVRSLMDTSRPEAESRLRSSLALRALAEAEQISVDDTAIEAKVREVSRGLSDGSSIDPRRLRTAVADDLLREKLLAWLEEHATLSERPPAGNQEGGSAKAGSGKSSGKARRAGAETADAEPSPSPRKAPARSKAAKASE